MTPDRPSFAGIASGGDHQSRGLALLPFPLSLRMVEELLAPAASVSYETCGCRAEVRPQPSPIGFIERLTAPADKWHLDEVAVKIAGAQHCSGRAVDGRAAVLDVWCTRGVQARRKARAAAAQAR
jgi:putative transposase